ncbi:MAG: hypothetical protein IPL71_04545 [Anaerolineales bacterium]|uniref:hypothetical protein n=1 Tax=Candidatus Villigracilis proximus TaxID=3140683 RepID=UPI003136F38D|nr:hypothetical protein [Anaerolineales bacterium]
MSSKVNPKQRALIIALIIFGFLFTVFFGMRALRAFRKFDGHRPPPPGEVETDVELVRDWMTVSFISRTYYVPEKFIYEALKISPLGNHDKSLEALNEEYYPDADGFVLQTVKATLLAHQPKPTPDSAPDTAPPPTAPPAP